VVNGDTAICVCDTGYHSTNGGLACEPNVAGDECQGVDCNTGGVCAVSGGAPVCVCGPGFHSVGATTCVADESSDPCQGQTCSDHGQCAVVSGNTAICVCDTGYHSTNGGLACEPNVVGDDGGTTVTCPTTAHDLAVEYAKFVCERNVACCSPAPLPDPVMACQVDMQQRVINLYKDLQTSLDANRAVIDCAAYDACKNALSSAACSDWPKTGFDQNLNCWLMVAGKIPIGGTCTSTFECDKAYCANGQCYAFRKAGESCDHNNSSSTTVCEPGLNCVSNVCTTVTKRGLGETCTPPPSQAISENPCEPGMKCTGSGSPPSWTCQWEQCEWMPSEPGCSFSAGRAASSPGMMLAALGLVGLLLRRRRGPGSANPS
jgi:MYXO-CTERM domain-containing protein